MSRLSSSLTARCLAIRVDLIQIILASRSAPQVKKQIPLTHSLVTHLDKSDPKRAGMIQAFSEGCWEEVNKIKIMRVVKDLLLQFRKF